MTKKQSMNQSPTTTTPTKTATTTTKKKKMSTNTITGGHVLRFIPNLIGYFRVACTLISLTIMIVVDSSSPTSTLSSKPSSTTSSSWSSTTWQLAALGLYVISFVADLVDGWAARKFQQSSQFGSMLDMITDRCSTLGLLYVLGTQSSTSSSNSIDNSNGSVWHHQLIFLGLMILDISSHWCQMYSTCLISQGAHHKSRASNSGRNILVQWYYYHYWFFGYLCVGAEFTYILTFLLRQLKQVQQQQQYQQPSGGFFSSSTSNNHNNNSWITTICYQMALVAWYGCVPGCILKQIINVVQLSSACNALARFDALQIQRSRESKTMDDQKKELHFSASMESWGDNDIDNDDNDDNGDETTKEE